MAASSDGLRERDSRGFEGGRGRRKRPFFGERETLREADTWASCLKVGTHEKEEPASFGGGSPLTHERAQSKDRIPVSLPVKWSLTAFLSVLM